MPKFEVWFIIMQMGDQQKENLQLTIYDIEYYVFKYFIQYYFSDTLSKCKI